MTAAYPKVRFIKQETPTNSRPGMAGKIAIIGAFDSTETDPILCGSINDAYTKLGTDTTYDGVKCIPQLFVGASSLLAVNITTKSGQTVDKEITPQKVTTALSKIKGENFDILFIACELSDAIIPVITTFLEESFTIKCPAGYIGAISRGTPSAYATTAELAGDFCYGLITQQFTVDSTELSLLESSAYYCGLIAGLNVGNSMTMKQVVGVTAISPEYTFETGDDGLAILGAGITLVRCLDRGNNTFVVVNSEQPNGLDLYINRTRDFVVKEFSLHKFLGERNRQKTLNEIKQEVDRVKDKCVSTLDLLEDINYTVEKKNTQCVDIYIDSLLFAGIITEIDVYVRIEVE